MLASVYNYRVMVKSISCCCVRERWFISNPVTFSLKDYMDIVEFRILLLALLLNGKVAPE